MYIDTEKELEFEYIEVLNTYVLVKWKKICHTCVSVCYKSLEFEAVLARKYEFEPCKGKICKQKDRKKYLNYLFDI